MAKIFKITSDYLSRWATSTGGGASFRVNTVFVVVNTEAEAVDMWLKKQADRRRCNDTEMNLKSIEFVGYVEDNDIAVSVLHRRTNNGV